MALLTHPCSGGGGGSTDSASDEESEILESIYETEREIE